MNFRNGETPLSSGYLMLLYNWINLCTIMSYFTVHLTMHLWLCAQTVYDPIFSNRAL